MTRFKYLLMVYGEDNRLLCKLEFSAFPDSRHKIIDSVLEWFPSDWYFYTCDKME